MFALTPSSTSLTDHNNLHVLPFQLTESLHTSTPHEAIENRDMRGKTSHILIILRLISSWRHVQSLLQHFFDFAIATGNKYL